MTQLSRPYQIALVSLGLLVLVWFVALRGHGESSGGGSASSAPASHASTPSAAAEAKSAATPAPTYSGPAPGVGGLTHAINKAHGAVAQSQREAKHVETAEPSSPSTSAGAAAAGASAAAASGAKTSSQSSTTSQAQTESHAAGAGTPTKAVASGAPAMQVTIERELQHKKTVLILFWNPRGSDDVAVRREVTRVRHTLGGKVAVHYALAAQVAEFGSFTRAVPVSQTPTLLIVNSAGQTTTLTGLVDAYAIGQAIVESHHS